MGSWLKMGRHLGNFLLVFLSILLTLLMAEGICWLILEPVDYLMPVRVQDDILGYRIEPNSAYHDAWGYRNEFVPATADIVAIGDSLTYGVAATAEHSWPAFLQQLTGRTVYNLSLGGYGPVQYFYLLKEKVFKLKPSLIIVGFYYGNDLSDAYGLVYKNNYWQNLRKPNLTPEQKRDIELNPKTAKSNGKFMQDIRDWFSSHSILYRIVTNSFIGDLFRLTEMEYSREVDDITMLENPKHNIYTGFTPSLRLVALNLGDLRVQEGLRITLEVFHWMQKLCQKEGVGFLVVLIPTKESVFAPYIENNSTLHNTEVIDELIEREHQVNQLVQADFTQHGIAYLDTLGPLRNAVNAEQIYPDNYDGHLNQNGYQIISTVVYQYLKNGQGY